MQDRTSVVLTAIILLLATGLIVLLGIQASSVWVGVLALAGLLACLFALGTARSHQYGGFWIGLVIGLAALAAAVWLSRLAGRFWWTPFFLFISLMFFSNGLSLSSEYEQPAGSASVIVGVLLFLFAILGPWLLYGPISGIKQAEVLPTAAPAVSTPQPAPTTLPQPTKPPAAVTAPAAEPRPVSTPAERGNFFAGLWAFLLGSVKSGWGIFYLALVILLGRIWLGKWGWLIAPILLLIAAGALAWWRPGGADGLAAFFATSPQAHVVSLLGWSERQLGSAAWGALIGGAGLVIALIPAYIQMYSANRAMVRAQRVGQVFGTTFAADLLRRSSAFSPYTSLVTLVTVAASVYGFILIWKALAAYAAVSGAPAFSLLGIADLSLPRWKPVMQWPYFLNAGIYALVSLIMTAVQRRMGLVLFAVHWTLIIVGAALLGFFVPAGTILFLTGQSLALGIAAPLSLLRQTRMAEAPRQPAPQAGAEQFLEELRQKIAEQERELKLKEVETGYEPAPPPPVRQEEPPIVVGINHLDETLEEESELLLEHPYKIVEMILTSPDNRVVFLDVYGGVWEVSEAGDETELPGFKLEHPVGLAAVSGGRLAAVDQAGRICFSSGLPEELSTAEPIHAFTVNSFGTILAYVSHGSTSLRGLILAAGKDQEFIDCGERLTDLCFSADNRYLGIGTDGGGLLIFDMARRQIDRHLKSDRHLYVSQIRTVPEGGWLAAYDHGEVALWNSEGEIAHTYENDNIVTSLAFDPQSGNTACGNAQGELTILDPDFEVIYQSQVHDEEITSVLFLPDGRLLTAGADGAIHRVSV